MSEQNKQGLCFMLGYERELTSWARQKCSMSWYNRHRLDVYIWAFLNELCLMSHINLYLYSVGKWFDGVKHDHV